MTNSFFEVGREKTRADAKGAPAALTVGAEGVAERVPFVPVQREVAAVGRQAQQRVHLEHLVLHVRGVAAVVWAQRIAAPVVVHPERYVLKPRWQIAAGVQSPELGPVRIGQDP